MERYLLSTITTLVQDPTHLQEAFELTPSYRVISKKKIVAQCAARDTLDINITLVTLSAKAVISGRVNCFVLSKGILISRVWQDNWKYRVNCLHDRLKSSLEHK